jgi:hypothetical protein
MGFDTFLEMIGHGLLNSRRKYSSLRRVEKLSIWVGFLLFLLLLFMVSLTFLYPK